MKVIALACGVLALSSGCVSAPASVQVYQPPTRDGADPPATDPVPARPPVHVPPGELHKHLALEIWTRNPTLGVADQLDVHARLRNVGTTPITVLKWVPGAESGSRLVEYHLHIASIGPTLDGVGFALGARWNAIEATDVVVLAPGDTLECRPPDWKAWDRLMGTPDRYALRARYRVTHTDPRADADTPHSDLIQRNTAAVWELLKTVQPGEIWSETIYVTRR